MHALAPIGRPGQIGREAGRLGILGRAVGIAPDVGLRAERDVKRSGIVDGAREWSDLEDDIVDLAGVRRIDVVVVIDVRRRAHGHRERTDLGRLDLVFGIVARDGTCRVGVYCIICF